MAGVDGVIATAGVSSHLLLRLLAEGVGVFSIMSTPLLSTLGVSAQPLLLPGVSRSVLGVSSQRLRRTDACPGVACPCSGVLWAGVASHT